MVKRTKVLLLAGASALAILVGVAVADADTFSIPGSYEFTVPVTGEYVITAVGGSGGNARRETGGLGAGVRGDIALTAGENLYLFVAQQGL
jgi:Glycine rich protein